MLNSNFQQLDFIDFAKDCKEFAIDLFENKKFGVVKVYGIKNQPALFLKEVTSFDFGTLKQIAKIQKICWNFQKVLFLYVYNKTEIRIYNCSEKPFGFNDSIQEKEFVNKLKELELYSCKESDKSKLATLNTLFSRIAIDTGFIWSSEEAISIRKKINLETRVDKFLVQSLIKTAKALKENGLNDKFIIHKLIMRSLFLFFLEDKKATPIELYQKFSSKANSFFDILENPDATYNLFKQLSDDFNGSLFNLEENEKKIVTKEHLLLIKKCFYDGNIDKNQPQLFSWKLFDFSIIRIELLSEIYENFLSELDKKEKKSTGTFYTPPSLVELILNEKLPIRNNETNFKVKTLDPSCGSGIFLVQSFKRLIKRYENKHNLKLNDFNVLIDILKTNIFGIEIDEKSIKVAAFSLYLALLDNLDPKTGWWNGSIKFPYLINDPEDTSLKEQGNNLFKRDTISDLSEIKQLQNFDLVVGNPPFGELLSEKKDFDGIQKNIRLYCNKQKLAKDMVLPFLHKATTFAPYGKIALVFNTKILTNNEGPFQNFREWLFNKNYVEKIYNFSILRNPPKFSGGELFNSTIVPISVIFYQKANPEIIKETITYYAPKTYIKNDVLEGIVIDSSDEKQLPRIECQKKDSKIWKIAMWGSYLDFLLVERISNQYKSLKEYFRNNSILFKTGLNSDSEHPDFIPEKIINAKKISRYFTLNSSENIIKNNTKYYRKINKELFKPPFIILKRFQKDKELVASYIDYEAYCTTTGMVINENINISDKKNIVGLINSEFSRYFLFMITSSWGIEREQINSDEFDVLPFIFDTEDKKVAFILTKIISIKKSNEVNQDISHLEKQIDQIIYNDILKLTEDEQIIIQDTLDYSLDLFEKQEKSKAVFPVNDINVYSKRVTKELNEWLYDVDLKVSVTHYEINRNCPLFLVKLSFGNQQNETVFSNEDIYNELKTLDKKLWNKEAQNLYFRKKLNYFEGDDVYIVKPNQRRFWSETAAMEDSKSLLVEILNMKE